MIGIQLQLSFLTNIKFLLVNLAQQHLLTLPFIDLKPMQYDQQQQLPPLVPLKKKRQNQSNFTPQPEEKSKHLQTTQPKTQQRSNLDFADQSKMSEMNPTNRLPFTQQKQVPKTPKQHQEKKLQSFSQKFKNIQQKSATPNKSTNKKSEEEKKEENQKSKFLIAEMLNKISVKNISEELYPITNETIETVIYQMEEEINGYKSEAQKKENTLLTNPNNQHLKQQIANLEKSIDHCTTIKELYQEKINFRNKIAILEGKIIELRAENRDLKIKVSRGIQKIQNHMHSLPCEKEKQLREKLNKCTEELKKEKEMRTNLQNNIQEIIMNFKRLYEEADTARLIVTKKLKQIDDRQRKINEAKLQQLNESEDQQSSSIKRTPKPQQSDEKRSPKPTNYIHDSESSTQRFRQTSKIQREREQRTDRQRDRQRTDRDTDRNKNQTIRQRDERKPMSFEESIQKMRGNQSMLSKIYNRN